MSKNIKNNQGFTLIELLIVMSLFGLIFVSLMGTFTMIIKNKEQAERIVNTRRQVGDGMAIMTREIINARALDFGSGDWGRCGDGDTSNSINIRNQAGQTVTISYDSTDNNIVIDQAGSERVIILGDLVGLQSPSSLFTCETGTERGRYAIEVSLEIVDNNSNSETYKSWAVIRNQI